MTQVSTKWGARQWPVLDFKNVSVQVSCGGMRMKPSKIILIVGLFSVLSSTSFAFDTYDCGVVEFNGDGDIIEKGMMRINIADDKARFIELNDAKDYVSCQGMPEPGELSYLLCIFGTDGTALKVRKLRKGVFRNRKMVKLPVFVTQRANGRTEELEGTPLTVVTSDTSILNMMIPGRDRAARNPFILRFAKVSIFSSQKHENHFRLK